MIAFSFNKFRVLYISPQFPFFLSKSGLETRESRLEKMNNSSPEGNIFFATLICISVILLANGDPDSCGNEVCNEDLCSRIRCRGFPREDCKGSMWVADGKCGCCNNCIIPLELGARCNPLPGYGIPNPVRYCRSGLTCDCKKRICVPCPNCRPRFS